MAGMNDCPEVVRRVRSTPAERAQWRERFAQSGLARREFAAQHNLRLQTLHTWLSEKSGSPKHKPNGVSTPALFVQLTLPALAPAPRWAEVVRADGWTIRLAHDVAPALLQQLLPAC
jgi:hypothetical protein